MIYNYLKALHLIFVITWFAGLFYIVRLFVYQIEAFQKPSPEKEILGKQFKVMTHRLWYIITWPSMILAVLFGVWMLTERTVLLTDTWMQVKLVFVLFLIVYHFICHKYFKQLQNDVVKHSSNFMRVFNEGATLVLFAVIFLVNFRYSMDWLYGTLGLIALALILMIGIKAYKRIRDKSS
ncbi:CopD family protein [uncultured Planktosalinus sp.]|uniref:CopD family protein n=1 Tax=uncultured Planktosalinus sp. TaxID=1810935 RepID=UPI0030D6E4D3